MRHLTLLALVIVGLAGCRPATQPVGQDRLPNVVILREHEPWSAPAGCKKANPPADGREGFAAAQSYPRRALADSHRFVYHIYDSGSSFVLQQDKDGAPATYWPVGGIYLNAEEAGYDDPYGDDVVVTYLVSTIEYAIGFPSMLGTKRPIEPESPAAK